MHTVSPSHAHHLEDAQRIAHVGSWERNLPGTSPWWSDESCRIMGIEPGTFTGTLDAFAFVHPDDRRLATPTDAQLATGTTLESEYRIVRPDGTVRVVHETAEIVRDGDGAPIRWVLAHVGTGSANVPVGATLPAASLAHLRERAVGGPCVEAWRLRPDEYAFMDAVEAPQRHSRLYAPFAGPDFVKIDLDLVRGVDAEPARQALAVPYGQGYLLGRPRDGTTSEAWPTKVDLPAFPHS